MKKTTISFSLLAFCLLILSSITVSAQSESNFLRKGEEFKNAQAYSFDAATQSIMMYCVDSEPLSQLLTDEELAEKTKGTKNKTEKKEGKFKLPKPTFESPLKTASNNSKATQDNSKLPPVVLQDEFLRMDIFAFPLNSSVPATYVSSEYFTNKKIDDINKYHYFNDVGKESKLITFEEIKAKFPLLNLGKEEARVQVQSVGEGMLGTKNPKVNTLVTKYLHRGRGITETAEKPFFDELRAKYKDMIVHYDDKINHLYNDSNDKFVSVLRNTAGDDNYSMYKNFEIFFTDKSGKVNKVESLKKNFAKQVSSFNYVYNEKGEKIGVMIALSHTTIAKKSLKDPVENNFHIFYSDFDGNIKLSKDIPIGNPENSRGLFPILITEKNGVLRIWNQNANKILKPFSEVIEIDMSGSVKTIPQKDEIHLTLNSDLKDWKLIPAGDKMLFAAALPSETSSAGTPITPIAYRRLIVGVIDLATYAVVSNNIFTFNFNSINDFDLIDESNGVYTTVVTTENNNFFAQNSAKGANQLTLVGKTTISPQISKLKAKSYVVDKDKKTVYFITSDTESKGNSIYYTYMKY